MRKNSSHLTATVLSLSVLAMTGPVFAIPAPAVDWCNLQYPSETTVQPGADSESIYGQVYIELVTSEPGSTLNLTAELGYGPLNSDPGTWSDWVPATFNVDTGNNDEYSAVLNIPGEGDYSYTFRYSYDSGEYSYGDLDGSANGLQTDQLGTIHVTAETPTPSPTAVPAQIDWCNLQYPSTTAVDVDTPTEDIYGRVYIDGVTSAQGATDNLIAELGWGAQGSDPTEWTNWVTASFNVDDGNNDEYVAQISEVTAGVYSYAYRYTYNGGDPVYGDLNGSTDGVQTDQLGTLYVGVATPSPTETPVPGTIGWCNLQWPPTLEADAGAATAEIYGRVYAVGITENTGEQAGLVAEIGINAEATDPATWNEWTPATFNVDAANDDEYIVSLTAPSTPGMYYYAYRYSYQGGAYCYGDLTGSTDGVQLDQLGVLTVNGPDGRVVGDFTNDGCTNLSDFLILLDNWQLPYPAPDGVTIGLNDFLSLLDNWQAGCE